MVQITTFLAPCMFAVMERFAMPVDNMGAAQPAAESRNAASTLSNNLSPFFGMLCIGEKGGPE